MKNLNKYGGFPYNIAVIHGGPGAAGSVTPLAKELAKYHNVIEPFQTVNSIKEQVNELKNILNKNSDIPICLIGHSWGAWLSYLFTAKYPEMIKKLILISSGSFEQKYVTNLFEKRINNLNNDEQLEINNILIELDKNGNDKNIIFERLGKLLSKADSYSLLAETDYKTYVNYEIYKKVWYEANNLRSSGKLLKFGKKIKCPVVAIHGDYDSHLADGVKLPLEKVIKYFKFILLEKCGHYPWKEKYAKGNFYKILLEEIV